MDGIVIGWLIGVGIILYIQWVIAKKFEKIAFQKGYNEEIHSFAMCFWLGLIGYLYVIALPDLTISRANINDENEKTSKELSCKKEEVNIQSYICPKCKEIVPGGIEACPVCHQQFLWNQ